MQIIKFYPIAIKNIGILISDLSKVALILCRDRIKDRE